MAARSHCLASADVTTPSKAAQAINRTAYSPAYFNALKQIEAELQAIHLLNLDNVTLNRKDTFCGMEDTLYHLAHDLLRPTKHRGTKSAG